jgi:hypothetical protein
MFLYIAQDSQFSYPKRNVLWKKNIYSENFNIFLQTITISVEAAKVLTPVDEVCTLPVY